MIQVESITYAYQANPPVFEHFSWQVGKGEPWVILGPSGCGKTTLLYLLAGLLLPESGQITINGVEISRPRPQTGLILQEYGLLPWATVRQNAELGLRVRTFYGPDGTHSPQDFKPETSVQPWLDRLGIAVVAEKYPGQISGGQRQRTAITRTLALDPDLLLMDEPFSSLDAPTREGLQKLTLELVEEQNITLVTVTHSIEEAVFMGRKILLLGQPPNHQPLVIDNPQAGRAGYRDSEPYQALCRDLRNRLGVA